VKKGNRVRELGSTGPYNGLVIEVEGRQVCVAWWSDRLKDYDRRDSDWMDIDRLEKYTVAPGSPGPKALRDLLP